MDGGITVVGASAGSLRITPYEGLDDLIVDRDLTLGSTDRCALNTSTRPPSAMSVGTIRVCGGNLGDLTGQRRTIPLALANDGTVIQCKGETGAPRERGTAIRRNSGDGELLADSQLSRTPRAANANFGGRLPRGRRCLGHRCVNLRLTVCGVCCCRSGDHDESNAGCREESLHSVVLSLLFDVTYPLHLTV